MIIRKLQNELQIQHRTLNAMYSPSLASVPLAGRDRELEVSLYVAWSGVPRMRREAQYFAAPSDCRAVCTEAVQCSDRVVVNRLTMRGFSSLVLRNAVVTWEEAE